MGTFPANKTRNKLHVHATHEKWVHEEFQQMSGLAMKKHKKIAPQEVQNKQEKSTGGRLSTEVSHRLQMSTAAAPTTGVFSGPSTKVKGGFSKKVRFVRPGDVISSTRSGRVGARGSFGKTWSILVRGIPTSTHVTKKKGAGSVRKDSR